MDVEKYAKDYPYGKLSGRNLEDIKTETRELDGQHEKKHSYDFALWKKASPEHIMHWPSHGQRDFPDGTWNAPQWVRNTWEKSSIYMGEVWI